MGQAVLNILVNVSCFLFGYVCFLLVLHARFSTSVLLILAQPGKTRDIAISETTQMLNQVLPTRSFVLI
jgi:hypothetical protein